MESKLVAGRYATIRELGRGGMGVVWLAEDRVIGRRVALKELRTSSPTEVDRVLREARTAGRLNSPAVVTVHDVLSEHGTTYIVMELVEAPTLADLMRGGPLPADRVASIGLEVLKALETAHAAGVVHRDVKPSNIMVLPDGGVKLADFGIARAMDDPGLTATGGVMGSPGYMAPELFHGRPPSPASDLWALGATLFHAAEGRSPFQRETTAATMHAIMYEAPVLRRTTGALAQVITGLLTQAAEGRATAAQVRALLTDRTRPVAAREPDTVIIEAPTSYVTTQPPSDTRPGWGDAWEDESPKPKRRVAVLAGAAVVVTALALTAVFVLGPDTETGRASGAQGTDPSSSAATTTSLSAASSSEAPSSTAPSSSTAATSTTTTTAAPATTTTLKDTPPPQATTPAKPPRQVTVFTRYRSGDGWHYSGSTQLGVPAGYTAEGPLGKLAVNAEPGTRPLYSCIVNNSSDRMTSVSANCENQQVYGLLGHIFTQQPADARAQQLYRCNLGGHHFESLSPTCEGKTVEFSLGWVLAN
ncbi:serine/threonine-protein kinase [Saccharothrix variisporea]|uniref:non-specific serine/threonine protein kinase n=1 Tax=Saccharothrix variisporea TaxID=543527 RepID=A0A495XFI9_9PSEU|nr:serine/threonine-protein kinase [Saccharothrix variisporea]RKT73040.1 serine/threonine protein kinase [Saccharothrix variisporea]